MTGVDICYSVIIKNRIRIEIGVNLYGVPGKCIKRNVWTKKGISLNGVCRWHSYSWIGIQKNANEWYQNNTKTPFTVVMPYGKTNQKW